MDNLSAVKQMIELYGLESANDKLKDFHDTLRGTEREIFTLDMIRYFKSIKDKDKVDYWMKQLYSHLEH